MKIYDVEGRLIKELNNSQDEKILFGKDLPEGIYFYKVDNKTGKFVKIK